MKLVMNVKTLQRTTWMNTAKSKVMGSTKNVFYMIKQGLIRNRYSGRPKMVQSLITIICMHTSKSIQAKSECLILNLRYADIFLEFR